MTNIRSKNYKLPMLDFITVKLKAGRIVPALMTTTAAISALQTIESLKVLKNLKLEKLRNSFVNFSLPLL